MVTDRAGEVSGASSGKLHSPGASTGLSCQLSDAATVGKGCWAGQGWDLPQIMTRGPAEGDGAIDRSGHRLQLTITRDIPAHCLCIVAYRSRTTQSVLHDLKYLKTLGQIIFRTMGSLSKMLQGAKRRMSCRLLKICCSQERRLPKLHIWRPSMVHSQIAHF